MSERVYHSEDWPLVLTTARDEQWTGLSLSLCPLGSSPELLELLGQCHSLRILDLFECELTEVPTALRQLPLNILTLMYNDLHQLPDWLIELPLIQLSLGGCPNVQLPANFDQSSIEFLDLSSNQLTEVPAVVGRMPKLKHLSLSSNHFQSIPRLIADTAIEHLNLSENPIRDFSLLPATRLRGLNLCESGLTTLPIELLQHPLELLDLSQHKNLHIPPWFAELSSLRDLNLFYSDCAGRELYLPPNLAAVSLRHCNISSIPQSIQANPQLRWLDLSGNNFADAELVVNGPCEFINLSESRLGKLTLADQALLSLKSLDLQMANVKQVRNLAQCRNLDWLRCKDFHLFAMPTTPEWLKRLRYLWLDGDFSNQDIPAWFWQLEQLQGLDLQSPDWTLLDERIGQLSELRHLQIRGTRLKHIPRSLLQLTKLHTLHLHLQDPTDFTWLANLPALCGLGAYPYGQKPPLAIQARAAEANFRSHHHIMDKDDDELYPHGHLDWLDRHFPQNNG
ncbi:leucine-rich repeat domain-containing protein [Herpetosiphon llansteffanensis]|uniref:leucine-rich repeat domain-containing protein n=1 Tax=Herpetosiphon llansteffanensis TaxID=2094568 RepID=UPI000D7BC4DA|nr:leucine-rich repeat domain-containing protein [Herpetosiphon llansteffanensis]